MTKPKKFAWDQYIESPSQPANSSIQEFIVYKKPDSKGNEYVIVKCDQSKEQNLEMLELIQEILNNASRLSPKQLIGYCKSQRHFMKLYFKHLQEEK